MTSLRRPPLGARVVAFGIAVASIGVVPSCGPVSGPWGTTGGEWAYVCGAVRTQGQNCGSADACASTLTCSIPANATVGTCAPRATNGAACKLTTDCGAGLVCKNAPLVGVCHTLVCDKNNVCSEGPSTGKSCSNTQPCAQNEACNIPTNQPGTCVAAPKVGDSCNDLAGPHACGPTLVCQRLTVKCVDPPKVGELCGMDIGPSACAAGLVCRTDPDPTKDGRCGQAVALGGTCRSAGECVKGTHCDLAKLVCAANKSIGDACPNGNECGDQPFDIHNGVDCVQGKCVDASKSGDKCWPGENNHCLSPLTCVPK